MYCRPAHTRRGVATVELAVCLPVIALLVFGSIQACNLVYLKHAITSAGYEGTLELSRPNSTTESVIARVDQVLDMYNVKKTTVSVLSGGEPLDAIATGEPVRIRVRADVDANLALNGWFPTPNNVEYIAAGPR